MCSTKLTEKDYRICMFAVAKDRAVDLLMSEDERGDLILRLSNNAEIAWLREQRNQ